MIDVRRIADTSHGSCYMQELHSGCYSVGDASIRYIGEFGRYRKVFARFNL